MQNKFNLWLGSIGIILAATLSIYPPYQSSADVFATHTTDKTFLDSITLDYSIDSLKVAVIAKEKAFIKEERKEEAIISKVDLVSKQNVYLKKELINCDANSFVVLHDTIKVKKTNFLKRLFRL